MPLTSDLPFWAVLRPETDTVLAWTVAVVLLVQLYETGTKGGAPLLHGLICKPLVWVPGLGRGVIRTPSEAVVLGLAIGGRLEHVMGRGDLAAVVSELVFQRRPSPRSPRHTWGSSVVKSSFCAFHARYTRLRPGCSVPGIATE